MRSLFLLLFLFQLRVGGFSQSSKLTSKSALDTSVLGKWPSLSGATITNNGKYVFYLIQKHFPVEQTTTVVQAAEGNWIIQLQGVTDPKFTNDSKKIVFISNDSLNILKLGSSELFSVPRVQSFKLVEYESGEWLVFKPISTTNELVIQDLSTSKKWNFTSIKKYLFSNSGETVLIETITEDKKHTILERVNLINGKKTAFWTGENANVPQLIIDNRGNNIAFITEAKGSRCIWYCKGSDTKATKLAMEEDVNIKKGFVFGKLMRFTKNGERLLFTLESSQSIGKPKSESVNVKIWDYRDQELQTEQINKLKGKNKITSTFFSVLEIKSRQILQIQQKNEYLYEGNDEYCVIRRISSNSEKEDEFNNNSNFQLSKFFLVSLIDGKRRQLPWKHIENRPEFSPDGKYIIYWESPMLNYYSYEVATGTTRNITVGVNAEITVNKYYYNEPTEFKNLIPIAGWLKDNEGVFIYDQHDIWLVDPKANKSPKNITNGYGATNNIVFRLGLSEYKYNGIASDENLILAAFNERTKENGYYYKKLDRNGDPTYIKMEQVLVSFYIFSGSNGGIAAYPIKAKNAQAYIVRRETATDFPNYFWTNDFKTYYQLSKEHPEKSWNWFTSELHNWTDVNGDTLQGILYKPENFDSKKKYPVIFSYYRQFSDELNKYQTPEWTDSRIDIAWFVSQGYLVFTPDIHYHIPKLKESVVNCVVSAATYVSRLPFVDALRMGIQGHSFGGLETGYLITNTNIFAAACSAAGSFNLISDAGSIVPKGTSRQNQFLNDIIYGTIWEKRNAYIQNSPLFDADKVTTPLLMEAGEMDNNKPFDQNIEFYLAMRKLGKKCWLLSYENEGHVLSDAKSVKDFTIRITQFFNHYLKNTPPPIWMTRGIPGYIKRTETDYVLDPSGNCGKDCKVCKKSNEQYNSIPPTDPRSK